VNVPRPFWIAIVVLSLDRVGRRGFRSNPRGHDRPHMPSRRSIKVLVVAWFVTAILRGGGRPEWTSYRLDRHGSL